MLLCFSGITLCPIDLSEGRFRWQLLPWLAGLLIAIQLMKGSIFLLAGWPGPDTWGSRLFLAFALLGTYLIPFLFEVLKGAIRRK